MTNALVLIEACSVCGLVQRVYLARRGGRRTPRVCSACARPWIRWSCEECGAANHEQVETLPGRGAFFGVCAACGREAERDTWTRSSREEAQGAERGGSRARFSPRGGI